MNSRNYDDVYRLHQKHRLPISTCPTLLVGQETIFRQSLHREEMLEFETACADQDLPAAADALIDLAVVLMGTAVVMGLPWQTLWEDVQRANMAKEVTDRGGKLIKPEGWEPPRSTEICVQALRDGVPPPTYTNKPKVVCLCGSTRFKEQYEYWSRHYALKGYIILSVGLFMHADDEQLSATSKAKLDQLHLHKIDMADEVFVINPGSYIGDSTHAEINYARSRGIPVEFLESETVQ